MWQTIGLIASAIAALCGVLTLVYKHYLSPAAKRKRKALENGKKAVDEGDVSKITSAFDKLRRKIIPVILLMLIAGCASPKVILHPIEKIDIVRIEKGTQIGGWITEKDGYFLSDLYLKEVMEAKVE